ncbi:hypothetical protein M1403_03435 [Patescibacteria group bacterium]|nr:hypothetical protein [Patescibacteria group bacterium]
MNEPKADSNLKPGEHPLPDLKAEYLRMTRKQTGSEPWTEDDAKYLNNLRAAMETPTATSLTPQEQSALNRQGGASLDKNVVWSKEDLAAAGRAHDKLNQEKKISLKAS